MHITITIQADNAGDLRNAIAALAGTVAVETVKAPRVEENITSVPDTSADELSAKKEEAKRKVMEKKQREAEQRAAEEAQVPDDDPCEDIPSDVALRELAAAKAKSAGKPAVKALLDKYVSASITAVPQESRIAFKKELEAL